MAYQANIPQAGDLISQSQGDILANFQALQTLIDINHVDFASGDQGKHKFVTFPVQSPAPTFSATEMGLYNFLNPTTTKNELYVNKIQGAGQAQVPMTASSLSAGNTVSNADFWTYLPSGILIISGFASNVTGFQNIIVANTAPAGAPVFQQIFTVLVETYTNSGTMTDINTAVRFAGVTGANTFNVYLSNRTTTGAGTGSIRYVAFGY